MRLVNIGHGNTVAAARVIAVVTADSAPARRASFMKKPSPDAAYSCHISPGQKPPVHQLLPSKGAPIHALPPR